MVLPLGDVEKTRITPVATYVLIALNILMYAVQRERGNEFTEAYSATPYEIAHNVDITVPQPIQLVGPPEDDDPQQDGALPVQVHMIGHVPGPSPIWLTLFTAMFLHGSPLHLAGNMLYLWIFGDNVEEVLGRFRFVIVYLACGVIATIFQVIANPNSIIPTLGASGAIAGVMGMYVIWFPHNRIRVLVFRFVTEMPAAIVIGIWIGIQILEGVGSFSRLGQTGGVAYLAHVGGAITGVVAAYLFYGRAQTLKRDKEAREGWFYAPEPE
jgi:membrane associated rhomboid family serine protease